VPEVATEAPVSEAGTDVLVAGDEPASELLVVEHALALAQPFEHRVRIGEERRIRRVEAERFREGHPKNVARSALTRRGVGRLIHQSVPAV
jgi:hypothetical protein